MHFSSVYVLIVGLSESYEFIKTSFWDSFPDVSMSEYGINNSLAIKLVSVQIIRFLKKLSLWVFYSLWMLQLIQFTTRKPKRMKGFLRIFNFVDPLLLYFVLIYGVCKVYQIIFETGSIWQILWDGLSDALGKVSDCSFLPSNKVYFMKVKSTSRMQLFFRMFMWIPSTGRSVYFWSC